MTLACLYKVTDTNKLSVCITIIFSARKYINLSVNAADIITTCGVDTLLVVTETVIQMTPKAWLIRTRLAVNFFYIWLGTEPV